MSTRLVLFCWFVVILPDRSLTGGTTEADRQAEVAGVKVQLVDDQGPATISAEALGKYELQVDVDPRTERRPLTFRVELPVSGRDAWPVADVEVLDSNGRAVSVRRAGIEWHTMSITAPAAGGRFVIHVVDPPGDRPRVFAETERHVADPATGLSATIGKWYDGRRAALSIRFDDSHPTHLSKAVPALREYGFRGTFMINPGGRDGRSPNPRWRSAFQEHLSEWEACARRGDQEFANHTMRHRGALNDEDMEREIGDAAKIIWSLFPGKSKLIALNLGGGTQWETTRTLRYYLDKHHLFAPSGSLGMDDVYGDRVAAFRRHLERNIESTGLGWCKIHFHSIGKGFASSEGNFRAALDIAKEHESDLWIAGMADVYKYLTERRGAKLTIENKGPRRALLGLSCSTDANLYDQRLTLDVTLPESWARGPVAVTSAKAKALDARKVPASQGVVLRFSVPPADAEYTIERIPSSDAPEDS